MESLTKQNLEQKLGMVEKAVGIIAYDRLKAQKQIELCDRRITKLEAEQTIIVASLNDLQVDVANTDKDLEEADAEKEQAIEKLTAQLKRAKKRVVKR